MGIGQEQRLYSFNCCLPGNLYLYTQGSQTIQEALTKLKRGMALGTGLGVKIGNPIESKQNTGGTAPIPFMMTSDKSVNFSTDTIVNESIKKVKYTIKQNNKEILQQIERVTVAFENLDRIDHQDQEIEVDIEIEEIVGGAVMIGMIGIVEVLGDHQIEVVMIEETIEIGIEMIQEIDIKGMIIDMIEEIDIVEKDQGHLEIIILENIEVEVIQVQDIKVVVDNLLRNVLFVVKQDIILKSVGIFKNIGENRKTTN